MRPPPRRRGRRHRPGSRRPGSRRGPHGRGGPYGGTCRQRRPSGQVGGRPGPGPGREEGRLSSLSEWPPIPTRRPGTSPTSASTSCWRPTPTGRAPPWASSPTCGAVSPPSTTRPGPSDSGPWPRSPTTPAGWRPSATPSAYTGRVPGPLHGVPVLVKDNIEVAGLPGAAGSTALLGRPAADAALVVRLRDAGAVVLGSTNLSEWANIRSGRSTSGWSATGGLVGNPWALDRSAGGLVVGVGSSGRRRIWPRSPSAPRRTDPSSARPPSTGSWD